MSFGRSGHKHPTRVVASSLPGPNYLDNLPKRLRDENKQQYFFQDTDDLSEQTGFLLDLDPQNGDLPFSIDMEDVAAAHELPGIALNRETNEHRPSPKDMSADGESPVHCITKTDYYSTFETTGPLELLVQHVQSYTKLLPNSYCKVRPTHDNGKMVEVVLGRQGNRQPLTCTVTFGAHANKNPFSKEPTQHWTVHVRKHQGSNSEFQLLVNNIKARALPGQYS